MRRTGERHTSHGAGRDTRRRAGHSVDPCHAWSADAGDRGSGTVVAVGLIGLVASLLVVALLLAAAVLAVHRARGAADLAAIGAARTVLLGGDQGRACREAAALVEANNADMESCSVRGDDVSVEASVPLPAALRTLGHSRAHARAKAGPE